MKIVTDSGADLPADEAKELGITVAPLFIQFPEGEIESSAISHDAFYDRLAAMRPEIPTTAQPSAGIFAELYRQLAEKGEEIFSIHISSGLSGTIQSAQLGMKEAASTATSTLLNAGVTLIDSLTLSGGERFQVLAAAWAAKAGWSREAIIERLDQIRAKTEVIYTLETLEYLARGGRIGRVQALAGSLLKIKPVIKVDKADGKYSTVSKGRTLKQTMTGIVDYLAEQYGTETPLWVSVLHGKVPDKAEELAEMLKDRLAVGKLEVLRISPVLGVHTGPGIVGTAVLPMNLLEGIV
ncbi:MAG: DegV family protein [Ardenticatenaceae bacterium]|nr:DegV family protein [Ardenticatenaceae bacterium]